VGREKGVRNEGGYITSIRGPGSEDGEGTEGGSFSTQQRGTTDDEEVLKRIPTRSGEMKKKALALIGGAGVLIKTVTTDKAP